MAVGTILIVDYHPEVVNVAKATLARASYDVLIASKGERALEILETEARVDLVLAEALMNQGDSGPVLVQKVRNSYPRTAVMLMTGFTDQPIDPAVPLLEKPFTTAALVDRVQRVILEYGKVAHRTLQQRSGAGVGSGFVVPEAVPGLSEPAESDFGEIGKLPRHSSKYEEMATALRLRLESARREYREATARHERALEIFTDAGSSPDSHFVLRHTLEMQSFTRIAFVQALRDWSRFTRDGTVPGWATPAE